MGDDRYEIIWDTEWTGHPVDTSPVSKDAQGNAMPVLTLGRGSASVIQMTPGIGWTRVEATYTDPVSGESATGYRTMRFVPCSALVLLKDAEVQVGKPGESTYDHRKNVEFVQTDSSQLNSIINGTGSADSVKKENYPLDENSFTDVSMSTVGGSVTVTIYKTGPDGTETRIDLSDPDWAAKFRGEKEFTVNDCGEYRQEYRWTLPDGAVIVNDKVLWVLTAEPVPEVEKKAANLSHPEGPTLVGDTLEYVLTASNRADTSASAPWADVVIRDTLPEGMSLLERECVLTLPDGSKADISAIDYDKDTRELSAKVGTLEAGESATLVVRVRLEDTAIGKDIGNVGRATGTSYEKGQPTDKDADPTDPVYPPGGKNVLKAPKPSVEKKAENLTRQGSTCVGDRIRYTIRAYGGDVEDTVWQNVTITDPMPEGLDIDWDTVQLVLPNGKTISVGDDSYDAKSRTLTVAAGDIPAGQRAELTFEVTVNESAEGKDIGNSAIGKGETSIPGQSAADQEVSVSIETETVAPALTEGGDKVSAEPKTGEALDRARTPKTGDMQNILLWVTIAGVAVAAFGISLRKKQI